MGCSTSRLDDEEAVQLCKDRKNFIKQAVEQRSQFSSTHIAYIHSLKSVSSSLRAFVDAYEPSERFLDTFVTPPFTPIKKTNPGLSNSPKSKLKLSFLRSEAPMAVSMEERPPSPEMARVEAFSPVHQNGIDGFFAMQSSPMNSSSFYSFLPSNLPNFPPPSPQTSQWDFFWNPFSSLDYYGYPTSSSLEQTAGEDEIGELRKVREEEGIPELEEEEDEEEEEETEQDEERQFTMANNAEAATKINQNFKREEVIIEDVDEEEEEDETESEEEAKDLQCHDCHKAQNGGKVDTNSPKKALRCKERKEESPGFTVYVNRKPTSMGEVMKELETQFTLIFNTASEVSMLLEASRATSSSTSNELTAMKMLNPVALFRSASSRSTSSRFLGNSRDEGYESSSDFSEESCMFSGSHQSTLDRLYAWEKKLYNEVKAGEKIRIAYEKKWNHLKEQDVKGDDPSSVEKTRVAIRDLYTQIKVSIHSVEAISNRIETLRDQELQPQLVELIHGLTRMWKVKAESHRSQKRTLDEAKLLLAGLPSKQSGKKHFSTVSLSSEPHKLPNLAANLETELRNWRTCFDAWITSQRSYVHAISGWLLRCVRSDPDTSKLPFSPRRSCEAMPVFALCIQWSRILDDAHDSPVLDGLDFFAAGMGSLYTQQRKEDYRRGSPGSKRVEEKGRNMEIVEINQGDEAEANVEEEEMSEEKRAEVAIRVLCAGMSVAMASLSEFSLASADGYDELVKLWEIKKSHQNGDSNGG